MKNIEIENISKKTLPKLNLEKVYSSFCEEEKVAHKIVNLIFCNQTQMEDFNFTYRKMRKNTDVLSFPMEEEAIPILGDIIINLDYLEQKNMEEEIYILFIHGLLHLIAYDHINQKDALKMQRQEKIIYDKVKENKI